LINESKIIKGMENTKKSVASRIKELQPGCTITIQLSECKYQSIASTLYRLRLEGLELYSSLSEDRSSVTVQRIR
jgi:hypothetical protein